MICMKKIFIISFLFIYKGLANFGVAPTVSNDGICTLEVHLFNFRGDLYGKNIKISFNKMIRPEIKFANIDELKTQIDIDVQSLSF